MNAFIEFATSGGGAWNAGPSHPNVTRFSNLARGQNVGRPGVYPYSCTNCTNSQGKPSCVSAGTCNPPGEAICNVQRPASEAGGTVEVTFNGFAD